jgi:rhomboid family GlyGly-CTERM serine protease
MKARRPFLWLFALPAALVALVPSLAGALLYDRTAVLQGEVWRLWTAHWVHFSGSHLLWNLVALALAGTWLEMHRPGWLWRYTLFAPPLITLILLVLQPAMTGYGGLSGLATGVVTLLGLALLETPAANHLLGLGLLALVAAKLAIDPLRGATLLATFASADVHPAELAHVVGAGVAAVGWLARRWFRPPVPSFASLPSDPAA